ncbi:16S rRNA (cytidine(1402)-2'-O)-methyltransferase [Macrococcoides caseolyticum]|uniref:16S rRNA (cytidine(1402)-2'-O)-methyltransferase n=1 Tax=Macrococcoides caseolyticum TaxID=69966 RepID=UPI001F1B4E7A|nr:16S rRNA (cytidine(1402)-2'-O)-methyltransferase [Macrococcus caseolyticus]MCE4957933.1 16S rRNA (cytidine(1402)-2'-O)-methyltransferase [Macrococcus caseolyticus]
MSGTLYLVGTPIGNLEDITFRAVRTLKEADIILCEDTRVTKKLVMHYEINTPLKSYHEHNQAQVTDHIIGMLEEGQNIALVSDAGLPLISDPGYELVVVARDKGLKVETVPGANAALTALMTSGISSYSFLFDGFLPRKDSEKKERLIELMALPHTLIIYESPFRVKHTLEVIEKIDGKRRISVARELTKKFEQVETDSVNNIRERLDKDINLKGEFVIVIEGNTGDNSVNWWSELTIEAHVNHYVKEGLRNKEAIKQVALDRHMKKNEVYQIYHVE